jgi:hypothetical protein
VEQSHHLNKNPQTADLVISYYCTSKTTNASQSLNFKNKTIIIADIDIDIDIDIDSIIDSNIDSNIDESKQNGRGFRDKSRCSNY